MDSKVKKFVNDQKVMAEKIRRSLGAVEVTVKFVETFPGVRIGNGMVADNVQKLIPFSTLILSQEIKKKRLNVEMRFVFEVGKKIELKKANDIICDITGTTVVIKPTCNILTATFNKDPQKIIG